MKIFKINTIILLTFVFSIGTIPVLAQSDWRAVSMVFVGPEITNTEIDNAYNSGFNVVILQQPRGYLNDVRSGKIKDLYPASIAYAHSKGMKVSWLMDVKQIPQGEDMRLYMSNPIYEEKLVSDITWILQNYNLDGLELEEPVIGGSGQEGRNYLNKLFTRLKALVDAKTINKPGFKYGFNSPSLWDVNIALGGIDQKYISDNRLFDYVTPQISVTTLNEYQNIYNDWSTKFPNLEKIPVIFVWWSDLVKKDACSWANGRNQPTTIHSVPACYNPALFEQAKWLNNNNVKFSVWFEMALGANKNMWPNDQTPGNNAREKMQWILSNNIPLLQTQTPGITVQSSSRTVTTGQAVTFSITATGTAPLTYQWQKNGTNIAGATSASYTTPETSFSDSGSMFRVLVTNPVGSIMSNTATLTVLTTSDSLIQNMGFELGRESWGFYTDASGTFDISQGYEGQNSAVLALSQSGTNIQLYQTDIILEPNTRYLFSFAAYSTTGHDATVRLLQHDSPYDTYMPEFTVNLDTNWQTFTTEFNTAGYFTSTVSDGRLMFWLAPFAVAGDTYYFDNIRLEKFGLPTITTHPSDQDVDIGQTSTFNVTANDTASLTYQWQKNGVDIPGATGASYTTSSTIQSDNGSTFRVTVTNSAGSVTSNNAILTVMPKNLIENPGFESGTSPWLFYTDGTGTLTEESPGYEGIKSSRIALGSDGTNIQLYQHDVTLEPNTRYRLSFAAYSNNGHDMIVHLFKHDSPYTTYMPEYTANLGTNWSTFSTEFNTDYFIGTVNDGRLQFWLASFAAAGDNYYIDNIRLEKIV